VLLLSRLEGLLGLGHERQRPAPGQHGLDHVVLEEEHEQRLAGPPVALDCERQPARLVVEQEPRQRGEVTL
jgi:hypothetical protein